MTLKKALKIPNLLAFFALAAVGVSSALAASSSFPFGHKPYREAPRESLVMAGTYRQSGRREKLKKEAAEAFQTMQQAAARDGVHLIAISAFRSQDRQRILWEKAVRRHGSQKKAAFWVAPPGYSEHHTGLALDVGDLSRPETDIEMSFEKTKAFFWLEQKASAFGFELSFPKDNGAVHYEPWHWRYKNSPEAQELFDR